MKSINIKKFILTFFMLCFITINIGGSAQADLVDPNIKSAMKIIQLHVQLREVMNKVDFDKSKFNQKRIFLYISKDVYKEASIKLNLIKKEVDFLCINLKNDKISPNVLLSITSALKSNIYDIYHIYPFVKGLKTYMLQKQNMPEHIKKEILSLLNDTKAIFGSVEKKIYNANIKRNPGCAAWVVGIAYGAVLVGTYYASSEYVENHNAPIENEDGSVTLQEYDPWWLF